MDIYNKVKYSHEYCAYKTNDASKYENHIMFCDRLRKSDHCGCSWDHEDGYVSCCFCGEELTIEMLNEICEENK